MIAYCAIEAQKYKKDTQHDDRTLTHVLLEKLVKVYKSHRGVDSENKWIEEVVGTMLKPIILEE